MTRISAMIAMISALMMCTVAYAEDKHAGDVRVACEKEHKGDAAAIAKCVEAKNGEHK